MTFEQLITLEMIIKKGSFKAAAESLYKTQPSLSVAIKKLEEEFNILLFNRDEYRPTLTEQGKTFYKWSQSCLRTFRELEVAAKELGDQKIEPKLEFILDPLVRFEAVQPVFEAKANLPSVTEFSFRTETMGAGVELLLTGDADFAIAPQFTQDERIQSVPFERIDMIPVVSKKLLKSDSINSAWLRTHRQIVVSREGGGKRLLVRDSKGVLGEGPKCFVTDHTMKRNLILSGFGWGRLASHEIKNEIRKGSLIQIKNDLATPFVLDLHVMRSKLHSMGPVARIIWDHLLEQAELAKAASKAKRPRA